MSSLALLPPRDFAVFGRQFSPREAAWKQFRTCFLLYEKPDANEQNALACVAGGISRHECFCFGREAVNTSSLAKSRKLHRLGIGILLKGRVVRKPVKPGSKVNRSFNFLYYTPSIVPLFKEYTY